MTPIRMFVPLVTIFASALSVLQSGMKIWVRRGSESGFRPGCQLGEHLWLGWVLWLTRLLRRLGLHPECCLCYTCTQGHSLDALRQPQQDADEGLQPFWGKLQHRDEPSWCQM